MKEQIIDKNKQLENAKCYDLAICEVIEYSRKDLQRIIGNEERANNR